MNILDIVILICLIPSVVQGFRKGFAEQVAAILSIVAGVWLSFRFSGVVCDWLGQWVEASPQLMRIIAFAIIFCVVIVAFFLLGKILHGVIKIVMLGWLDRLLGLMLGFLKAALLTGLLLIVFNSLNETFGLVDAETLADSRLFAPMRDFAYAIFPYFKELLHING